MSKIKFFYLIILILQCLSKKEKQFGINFDYSYLNTESLYIKKRLSVELTKISNYFKNLLIPLHFSYLYRLNKKNTERKIECQNLDIKLKYEKGIIDKNTYLLIFPRINIIPNIIKKNNPNFIECFQKGSNSIVFFLDFTFKSEKEMERLIPLNFKNEKYQWKIIKYIISSIGFNLNYFSNKKIVNNILLNNEPLLQNYSFYKSYLKFSFLTNLTYNQVNQSQKYLELWPSFPDLDDVMEEKMNPRIFIPSITEMTINILEKMGFKVNPCELILYNNTCYKVNQKCLNEFNYEDYYIQYSLDIKNKRWICYYKTQEHFKNKQCSSDYGVLLSNEELNKQILIDFLRKNDYQNIILLKPASTCPKPHPRTVFYMTVKEKEDPYQYKILERTEEVTIKDPNYFVITNTFSNYYNVKSRAAIFNNILANNQQGWNYNYLWKVYQDNAHDAGIYQKINKYQFIGNFPLDNTFKDGLNRFYNKQKMKFPEDYNYIPETYLFPDDKYQILEKFKDYQYNPEDVWLFKPARSSFAHGIKIINNYTDIKNANQKSYLISRYIMNPLLINGKKFDFRAYVLVTGMNPLKIYFYKDGYLKISVKNFTLSKESINDGCIHITTSDTNLECFKGKEYKYDTDIYDEKSHFWSYLHFERYCNKRGINYTNIMEQMKDIFIKTFISLNVNFLELIEKRKINDRNLFQLYGLDLMVDENNKVHLLELNRNPSMRNGHGVCDYMYDNLITDILNIIGIVPFKHDETQETFDKDVYIYDDKVEEIVDDSLCEFGRPRGMFELIYPKKNNVNKYKKFYQIIFDESQLLWDKLLESNGEYD